MNLKKTALIAEILGGLGIIVSILYLGFEVSQNTKNTEIANHLALIEQIGAIRELHMTDETMAALVLNGSTDFSSLSDIEQDQFYWYTLHSFDMWETGFLMNERDGLPDGTWGVWNYSWCEWLRKPGFRELWESGMRNSFNAQFRRNVEQCYLN